MSTYSDNVYSIRDGKRQDRTLGGRSDAATDLRRRFKANGKAQRDVFIHLARRVHLAIEDAKFKPRGGQMTQVFGDLLKQKLRFVLKPEANPGTLCQNPGNWLRVLEGLAQALDRDPDAFLLDMMAGSPLLPTFEAPEYGRKQWLGSFADLVLQLGNRLTASVDYSAIAAYLTDNALTLEGDRLEVIECSDDSCGFDGHSVYAPWVLDSVPRVMGLNHRKLFEDEYETASPNFLALLERCYVSEAVIEGQSFATVRGATRTGLALAICSDTGEPTMALVEWEVLELVFGDGSDHERRYHLHGNYGDVGHQKLDEGRVPNSVRFRFVGSSAFDALASTLIVFPDIWNDDARFNLWDPGSYVDVVYDFPTDAPGRTVAAVVERNLCYAAPDNLGERIDTRLLSQLEQLKALVESHHSRVKAPAIRARQALLSEWQATTPGERPNSEIQS